LRETLKHSGIALTAQSFIIASRIRSFGHGSFLDAIIVSAIGANVLVV
jgi:hypothetical protein